MKKQTFTSAVTLLTLIGGVVCPYKCFALTASGNLTVSATVVPACTVNSPTLAFGNYFSGSASAVPATATITTTCGLNVPYTVTLNGGTTAGGLIADRRMAIAGGGGPILNYSIRTTNSIAGQIWGDGTGGSATSGQITGSGNAQNLIAYGFIPAGQNPTAGVYGDTVAITVTY